MPSAIPCDEDLNEDGEPWRRDGKTYGIPPPRFQCEAIRKNGKRCRKWRLRDKRTCQFHGGRSRTGSPYQTVMTLPRLYSKHLSGTLLDAVEHVMGQDPREALNLFEELALMRVAAGDAIKLYNAAHTVEGEKGDAIRTQAAGLMAQALSNVQSMCESAARIELQGKDKLSIHSLKAVVDQVVYISYKVFKDHPDLVKKFQETIAEQVRMPKASGIEGTDITPDRDVVEMDETIPAS